MFENNSQSVIGIQVVSNCTAFYSPCYSDLSLSLTPLSSPGQEVIGSYTFLKPQISREAWLLLVK